MALFIVKDLGKGGVKTPLVKPDKVPRLVFVGSLTLKAVSAGGLEVNHVSGVSDCGVKEVLHHYFMLCGSLIVVVNGRIVVLPNLRGVCASCSYKRRNGNDPVHLWGSVCYAITASLRYWVQRVRSPSARHSMHYFRVLIM